MTLGRVEGNIRFESDSQISRLHCRFHVAGGSVFVEDLDSTNQTLVNRVPIIPRRRRRVLLNDVIKVGKQRLILTRHTTHQPPGSQDETSCHRVALGPAEPEGELHTTFIHSPELKEEPEASLKRHSHRGQREQQFRAASARIWGERLVYAGLAMLLASLFFGSLILLVRQGH